MPKNNQVVRKKGFSFLSFFLGFLIGIIFLIGSIGGVIYYALSAKIDDVLGMVGVDNSKDENGNQAIINTDTESGGVSTFLELISKVGTMASDFGSMSVGEVENLIPAMRGMVDGVHGAIAEYIDLDRAELVATKFSDFGTFVQNKVLEIQPAALMGSFGMGESLNNPIFSAVFYGAEAKYVVNGEEKYPVYYDTYSLVDGKYQRAGDNKELPEEYEENLVESGENFRLNYYLVGETCYITDGEYTYTAPAAPAARVANGAVYRLYSAEQARLSGNYYIENGEKKVVTPITLGSFNNISETLEGVYLDTLLTEDEENELAKKVLAGISLGDIMGGKLDFEKTLSNLPLSDLVEVSADDGVMMSLIYKISGVTAAVDQTYAYTGTYKYLDGEAELTRDCFIEVDESGKVTKTYYIEDGKDVEFPSISVADLMDGLDTDSIMEDMTVNNLMDIGPTEAIMAYIGYGVYRVEKVKAVEAAGLDYQYTALYDVTDEENGAVECFIKVKEGDGGKEIIESVYYFGADGEKVVVGGTPVNEINDKVGNLTYKLTVGELVESDNKILNALKDKTVNDLGDGINELKLGQILDIDQDSSPILRNLADTEIGNLSGAIDNLTLGKMVDNIDDNFLLKNLKDKTIKQLPDAMLALTINDLYADSIYCDEEEGSDKTATRYAVTAETFNADYIYYVRDGDSYSLANGNGKLNGLSADDKTTYYTYGEAKGMWKMLLYVDEKDSEGNVLYTGEKAYSLSNLTDMMDNVAENMSDATLYDLHDNKLLIFSNPDDLNRYIDLEHTKTLGQLSLTEAIAKCAGFLGAFGSATERPAENNG